MYTYHTLLHTVVTSRRARHVLMVIGVAALALCFLWWVFAQQKGQDAPVFVNTTRPATYALTVADGVPLSVEGELVPQQDTYVAAESSGSLTRIYVQEGAVVRTGDVLAVVGQPILVAQRETLRAQINALQAERALADASSQGALAQAETNTKQTAALGTATVAEATEATLSAAHALYLTSSAALAFFAATPSVTNVTVNDLRRDAATAFGGYSRSSYLMDRLRTGANADGLADTIQALIDANAVTPSEVSAVAEQMLEAGDLLVQAFLEAEREAYRSNSSITSTELATFNAQRAAYAAAHAGLAAALQAQRAAETAAGRDVQLTQRAEQTALSVARQEASVTDASIELLRAQLRELDVRLGKSVVRAPFAGTVTDVLAEQGMYVAPGTPVVRLQTASAWEVELHVAESTLASLHIGTPAVFAGDVRGTVSRIAPLVTDATGGAAVYVALAASSTVPVAGTRMRGELLIPSNETDALHTFFAPHAFIQFDFSGPYVRAGDYIHPVQIVRDTHVGMYIRGSELYEGMTLSY